MMKLWIVVVTMLMGTGCAVQAGPMDAPAGERVGTSAVAEPTPSATTTANPMADAAPAIPEDVASSTESTLLVYAGKPNTVLSGTVEIFGADLDDPNSVYSAQYDVDAANDGQSLTVASALAGKTMLGNGASLAKAVYITTCGHDLAIGVDEVRSHRIAWFIVARTSTR